MPTLSQATAHTVESLGFHRLEPTVSQAPDRPQIPKNTGLQFTRCPVPPISISPDSVQQFNRDLAVPVDRILSVTPLFTQVEAGPTTMTVSRSALVAASSSTVVVTPSTTSTVSALTTAITTPSINQNEPYTAVMDIARSFVLLRVSVSSSARVEFYSTASSQTNDISRSASTPITLGSPIDLIGDFYLFDSSELVWTCSPAPTGFNGDSPSSASIYVTVTNLNPTSAPITVSILYFPLES